MRGPAKPRRLDEPIAVSREDLGPYDHVSFTMQVDAATLLERLLNGEARPRRRLDPKNWRHPPQSAQVAQMNPLCTAQQTRPGAHAFGSWKSQSHPSPLQPDGGEPVQKPSSPQRSQPQQPPSQPQRLPSSAQQR
jgi:hypothetical protein